MKPAEAKKNTYHQANPPSQQAIQDWFFTPLLNWQQKTWQYVTQHYQNDDPMLPHAMLIAGNAGTGKRAFVYRFVAWAFCQNIEFKQKNQTACQNCESCQWLIANSHPNFYQILPENTDNQSIKIDDIRTMQPFAQQSSQGVRIIVIHQAQNMTLGASNALLKTLEEPAKNVLIFLISDQPTRLLPTIRSRLQSFDVSHVGETQSLAYLQNQLPNTDIKTLKQVNHLCAYSPFVALDMLTSDWYAQRQIWINSWQAVRSGARTPVQASDYWQKTLNLTDFLHLSQMMLNEIANQQLNFAIYQQDIDTQKLQPPPHLMAILQLQTLINHLWQDKRQHIQDKLCYDKLINAMQMC